MTQQARPIPFKPATPAQPAQAPAADPAQPANPAAAPITMEAIQEAIAAAVKPIMETQQRFSQRFPEQAPARPTAPEDAEIGEEEFYADPRGAARRIAEQQARRVFQEQGTPAAELAYRGALQSNLASLREAEPDLALVEKEFQEYIAEIDPSILVRDNFKGYKGNVSGLQMAAYTFLGQNRAMIAERRAAAEQEEAAQAPRQRARVPFSERPAARGSRGSGGDRLSDEEKEVAKKLGFTDEQYLAERNAAQGGLQTHLQIKR